MEVIKLSFPHQIKKNNLPPLAMCLGYFDGVHLGHQQVILEGKKIAKEKGLKSAVMTFDPHPSVVLGREIQHVKYITPLEEKIKLIEALGVDYLFVVQFTHNFSTLLPQEFVDYFLLDLNVHFVIAGFDFSYGVMGKGTMETLPFHSREQFDFTVVPKFTFNGEKISSTLIRSKIIEGKTDELKSLLGRFYCTSGEVVHGDKRGRTIGFPTANIDSSDDYLLPGMGVYSVRIFVRNKWYEGVCNVGNKPTFNKEKLNKPSVEVHIFNFNDDIYGQHVQVEWHERIRGEKKFTGIVELVQQINLDKLHALAYFEKKLV